MPRKPRNSYTDPVLPQRPAAPTVRIMPPPQREAMYADSAEESPRRSRSNRGRIDDDTFAGIVRAAIDAASNYDRDQLQADRLRAYEMYTGKMDEILPPNENGSSVVSFDVRDTLHAVLPSLERIFLSDQNIIEYVASNERQEQFCQLATKYVNKLLRDRLGVLGLRNVMLDIGLSKVGVVKWYWQDNERVVTERYTGLDDAAFGLVMDPNTEGVTVEIVEHEKYDQQPDVVQVQIARASGQPPPEPLTLHDAVIRYRKKTRKLCIEPMPPEERLMDPNARRPELAAFRGHRTAKMVYELVEMGYDRDDVLDAATTDIDTDPTLSQDNAVRQPGGFNQIGDNIPDDDYREVMYVELYIHCDRDGDGFAELIRVCTLGNAYKIVAEDPVDIVPMAEGQMLPMPHTVTGRSFADNMADIQIQKTALHRGVMESLPHSIYPRFLGVEGKVNWDDLLSNLPGQPIRVKDPAAVQQFKVDFVGAAALQVMEFIDDNVREPRTGMSKAAQGLQPDALQSTPSVAAASIVSMTVSQLEDYARMIGATLFVDLGRGLLREIVTNQRDPDWMKVNDQWVQVDPRMWDSDMEISIDVTGGTHGAATKVPVLQQIAAAQQQAITTMGPNNPLCGLPQLYNTLSKIINLTGVGRVEQFWTDPARMPNWTPPPPPGQGQDPNAAAAQAMAEADLKKAKIADDTKRYQIQLEDDRARDKNESDVVLKGWEILQRVGIMPPVNSILQMMRLPRPPSTLPAPPNPQNPPDPQQQLAPPQ